MKPKKGTTRRKSKKTTELPLTDKTGHEGHKTHSHSHSHSHSPTFTENDGPKGNQVVFDAIPRKRRIQKIRLFTLLTLITIVLCTITYFAVPNKSGKAHINIGKNRTYTGNTQQKWTDPEYAERVNEDAEGERILEYAERDADWYLKRMVSSKGETVSQVIEETATPFRVLFNCDIYTYTHSTNRAFFTLYDALRDIDGVEAHLWGPGFPNYNDDADLAHNIEKVYGSAGYFDFVFNSTLRLEPTRKWLGPGSGVGPIAALYQDCFHKEKLPGTYKQVFPCEHKGADLYFHTYANQMGYYSYAGYGNLIWHLPHFVSTKQYTRDIPHTLRPIDILIVGSMWSVYPLRVRFLRMFDENKLPGTVRRLVARNSWLLNTTDATPTERFIEGHAQNADEYIRTLQSAKIVLVCSSKRNIAVRTYIEAAAAGALVIGDIPGEREDEFRSWVVEVSPKQTDETIIHTIKWWLTHSSERETRAKKGQDLVLNKYTQYNAGYEVVEAMQSYITGYRGLVFPHRFSSLDHFLPKTIPCARSLKQIEKASQK